eukprot:6123421-Alexandrium_andersonii.AAC.1
MYTACSLLSHETNSARRVTSCDKASALSNPEARILVKASRSWGLRMSRDSAVSHTLMTFLERCGQKK